MDLYYLNFNNYYNRQVKRFDTLTEYLPFLLDDPEANRNFNPANDIEITFIANRTRVNVGDYFLAVDNGEIKSRWFILNGDRTRQGQYRIVARRDVVADYFSQTITAPCFIEKAKLETGDPMIFNKEEMTVNQIKTSETLLKDRTGCAWVVGYIPRNALSSSTHVETQYIDPNFNYDYEYESLTDFPLYYFINNPYYDYPTHMEISVYIGATDMNHSKSYQEYLDLDSLNYDTGAVNKSWTTSSGYRGVPQPAGVFFNNLRTNSVNRQYIKNYLAISSTRFNLNLDHLPSGVTLFDLPNYYRSFYNKIIRVGTGGNYTYYKINTYGHDSEIDTYNDSSYVSALVSTEITNYCNMSGVQGTADNESVKLNASINTYNIQLTQLFVGAQTNIDDNRNHLEDSPYDMFCIPYSDDLQIKLNGANLCMSNKNLALSMATAIGEKTGLSQSNNLYDIQLLPYCPVQGAIKSDGSFDIIEMSRDEIYASDGTTVIGVILWCDKSNFSFDIENEITVLNPKVSNQCDKYRLVSPNYNGQFDFNVAMNGGMTKFNVDCTYKPFSPYIHINPDFGLLYGSDFNDARGLICGGDFSLPQVSDPWANYQLQNKNYQAIFDRQIQNMETNYYYQNMSMLTSGSINALGTGVTTGVLAGAGFGVASGLTSVAGLAQDYYINRQLQNEALDYTRDLFGYNLGNIQALPESLTKVTAFNSNNKIFPILEYYTCTDVERQAFENKIRWNGMTVMRIGTIQEFIRQEETYIKGKIIRLEGVNEPTNVLNEIANEINKGVFIDGRNTTSD